VVEPIYPDDFDRVLAGLAQYRITLNQPAA
jgi:hypothetical protein